METKTHTYVAIDVAKDDLQIQIGNHPYQMANNAKGYIQLYRQIRKLEEPLVVYEATGNYERKLMEYCFSKDIAQARINPALVRHFAGSEGIKAKNDPTDARMILRYAQQKHPQPMSPRPKHLVELADLLDRRSHLSEQLTKEKNRLEKGNARISASIERMIRFIKKETERVDADVQKLIQGNPILQEQAGIIESVKGAGKITAWTILAYLPEITELPRNKIVALAGLAPFDKDSAKQHKPRRIFGGRAKIRKCLYMTAMVAAVHNPVIKSYVEGLRARGKPYKSAMVAAMRKLLLHIQSQLKNPQPALDL